MSETLTFDNYSIKKIIVIDDEILEAKELTIDEILQKPEVIADRRLPIALQQHKGKTIEEVLPQLSQHLQKFISETIKVHSSQRPSRPDVYNFLGDETSPMFVSPNMIFKQVEKFEGLEDEKLNETKYKKWFEEQFQAEERILIILDKELAKDNWEFNLAPLLRALASFLLDKNISLVIYTNEPEDVGNDIDKVDNFLNSVIGHGDDEIKSLLRLHMNFIQKSDSLEELKRDYDIALRRDSKARYINNLNNIYKRAIEGLQRDIWSFNENENILYYDYLAEGQHLDDILYDMFQYSINHKYQENIQENHAVLINPLRKSIQKYVSDKQINTKEALQCDRLIKEVKYDTTSKPYLDIVQSNDIKYGDIIEVTQSPNPSSYYVVVSQDCDIAIRDDGTRRITNFTLLEIIKKNMNYDYEWFINFVKDWQKRNRTDSCFQLLEVLKAYRFDLGDKCIDAFIDRFIGFYNAINDPKVALTRNEKKECNKILISVVTGHLVSNVSECSVEGESFDSLELNQVIKDKLKLRYILSKLTSNSENLTSGVKTSEKFIISSKNSSYISIPCLWLDALKLKPSEENIEITEDSINKSKEIRYPSQKSLKDMLTVKVNSLNAIFKTPNEQKEIIDAVLKNEFSAFIKGVGIEAKVDSSENKISGFVITNMKRIGNLGFERTTELLQEAHAKNSRIPQNKSVVLSETSISKI